MSKYINLFHFLPVAGFLFLTQPVFAQQEVQFFGTVTNTTCDVILEVNGAVSQVVDLGTLPPNAETENKDIRFFRLKPDMTQTGCLSLKATDTIRITLTGPWAPLAGFRAQSGDALDAFVEVNALNNTSTIMRPWFYSAADPTATFTGDVFTSQGAWFGAVLHPGNLRGMFRTAMAYAVTWD